MASAFALTWPISASNAAPTDAGGAFAAYITGNVASNLVGRLLSAARRRHFGLASNFYLFALLNLAGAVLVYFTIERLQPMHADDPRRNRRSRPWSAIWRNPALRAAFAIGFCILFAFIGTFTYVNFVLVRAPLSLGMMGLGFVYFVFLPSIVTTPFAGRRCARFGTRRRYGPRSPSRRSDCRCCCRRIFRRPGRPGADRRRHVLRPGVRHRLRRPAASDDRASASGLYLACYFFGGLVGSAVLGQVFDASAGPLASPASACRSRWRRC